MLFKNAGFYYSYNDCAYISGNLAHHQYATIRKCSEDFYHALLIRGWRRFGEVFFVPFCDYCEECISIRQRIDKFSFSKNQSRVLNKNKHIRAYISAPSYSDTKLALYNKYHATMHAKKEWDYKQIDAAHYIYMFVDGHMDFGKEIEFYYGERLVAVAFFDVLLKHRAISALYCFYDHEFSHLSLGTYSLLFQIKLAMKNDIKFLYPGFWIKHHCSLGYKERFKPFEILINRPNIHEEPIWRLWND